MSVLDSDIDAEMNDVWKELQASNEPESREFLLVRLAEFALEQHDFSDPEIDEEIHEEFEGLRQARQDYHLRAVRVGRAVTRMIEEHEMLKAMQAAREDSSAN